MMMTMNSRPYLLSNLKLGSSDMHSAEPGLTDLLFEGFSCFENLGGSEIAVDGNQRRE